jgi:hypothetical protein
MNLNGYYMHAPPDVATERALERFKRGNEKNGKGRYVPPDYILGATENEKHFDEYIPAFRKWGVYDNNTGGGGAPRHVASGANDG